MTTLPTLTIEGFDDEVTVHDERLGGDPDCGGTLVVHEATEATDDTPATHAYIRCAACDAVVAELCIGCGDEWITADERENGDVEWTPSGDVMSRGCAESEWSHASTLIRFAPGQDTEDGANKVVFGNHLAMGQYGETPGWFDEMFPDGPRRVWKSTSGWRGHHDTYSLLTGFTRLTSGWMTGDYDDVPWKRDTHRLMEFLAANEPPVAVYVLFEPTSNVFSMGTDIFTADADHDALVTWLDEAAGLTEEAVTRAFG